MDASADPAKGNHALFAIIAARVCRLNRRIPIKIINGLEWNPMFGQIGFGLVRIPFIFSIWYMLSIHINNIISRYVMKY